MFQLDTERYAFLNEGGTLHDCRWQNDLLENAEYRMLGEDFNEVVIVVLKDAATKLFTIYAYKYNFNYNHTTGSGWQCEILHEAANEFHMLKALGFIKDW